MDKNDNAPAFVYDDELSDLLSSNQYLVSIQDNTPVNSNILQIQVQPKNVCFKDYVGGGGAFWWTFGALLHNIEIRPR